MALPDIFSEEVSGQLIERISKLSKDSASLWGKMNAAQMLAHCCVTYEMIYENKHPKPGAILRFILKNMIKKKVTNEEPYPHSIRTAPQFIINDSRDFDTEKKRLTEFIIKTQKAGREYLDNKESNSFGVLSRTEWNNMLYKHLDHHLRQFGV